MLILYSGFRYWRIKNRSINVSKHEVWKKLCWTLHHRVFSRSTTKLVVRFESWLSLVLLPLEKTQRHMHPIFVSHRGRWHLSASVLHHSSLHYTIHVYLISSISDRGACACFCWLCTRPIYKYLTLISGTYKKLWRKNLRELSK